MLGKEGMLKTIALKVICLSQIAVACWTLLEMYLLLKYFVIYFYLFYNKNNTNTRIGRVKVKWWRKREHRYAVI